jgi:hypothetical protein
MPNLLFKRGLFNRAPLIYLWCFCTRVPLSGMSEVLSAGVPTQRRIQIVQMVAHAGAVGWATAVGAVRVFAAAVASLVRGGRLVVVHLRGDVVVADELLRHVRHLRGRHKNRRFGEQIKVKDGQSRQTHMEDVCGTHETPTLTNRKFMNVHV